MKQARGNKRRNRRLLIAVVRRIVAESGDELGFESAAWLKAGMSRPCPSLGFRHPSDFTHSASGTRLVGHELLQMQSGAYARIE